MKKNDFELMITSSEDREKLTCEIYFKNELIAEISQETNELLLEIYTCPYGTWWEVPLVQFQETISAAKEHLLSN